MNACFVFFQKNIFSLIKVHKMHLLQPAFLEKKSRHFVMDHVHIIHSQIRNMFEMFSAEYGQVCVGLFTHD